MRIKRYIKETAAKASGGGVKEDLALGDDAIFEMATMCYLEDGYGIEVEVQSNDHIQPHAHVYDKHKKPVGRFLLFVEPPKAAHEILPYPGDDVSSVKYNIFKWAPANNKPFQKAGIIVSNWKATIIQWNTFHKDKPVPEAPASERAKIINELAETHNELISAIEDFSIECDNLSLELASIFENVEAYAKIRTSIARVQERKVKVETLHAKYERLQKQALAQNVKIAQIVSAASIKTDIKSLRNSKASIGIAKERVRNVINDNNLHQDSTAQELRISLEGGVIQRNGQNVKVEGYANEVLKIINGTKEILQNAGICI